LFVAYQLIIETFITHNYQLEVVQERSPLILLASCISLGIIVTLFACMAHRLVSSNSPTMYASAASCSASTAWLWKRRSLLYSCAISRTSRWNGSFLMSSSVDFWNLRISRRATVPGRKRCGFFTPPGPVGAETAAVFLAALLASCFLGALAPVFLRAVYLVRAIKKIIIILRML